MHDDNRTKNEQRRIRPTVEQSAALSVRIPWVIAADMVRREYDGKVLGKRRESCGKAAGMGLGVGGVFWSACRNDIKIVEFLRFTAALSALRLTFS